MTEISIVMRVIKCIHLFDEILDELSSFDLCVTQKYSKEKFEALLLENERRTNKESQLPYTFHRVDILIQWNTYTFKYLYCIIFLCFFCLFIVHLY